MSETIRSIYRIWFTGVIYCLAGAGYVFYFFLHILRNTKKILMVKKYLFLTAALSGLAIALFIYLQLFFPFKSAGQEIEINISRGEPVSSVIKRLYSRQIIPSKAGFAAYIKLRGVDRQVQAGIHSFRKYEGAPRAADNLLDARQTVLNVTIPEGKIIEECASYISSALPIDEKEFVELCRDRKFIKSLGLKYPSLEGYLFPDTYEFLPDAVNREIIKKMVNNFEEKWNLIKNIKNPYGLSRHELVILASIVEKESTLASERGRIAGVFYNRLNRGIPLGADPTVRYALKKFSGPLRVSELKNRSPYNTRVHSGLPPGPICSPGLASLKAVLAPDSTEELYFVAKWDGSGGHYFSKTNSEHVRKKLEVRRRNQKNK